MLLYPSKQGHITIYQSTYRGILLTFSFLLPKNNPTMQHFNKWITLHQGCSVFLLDSFLERSAESKVPHSLPVTKWQGHGTVLPLLSYTLPVIIFKIRTKALSPGEKNHYYFHVGQWHTCPCVHVHVHDVYVCVWACTGMFLWVSVGVHPSTCVWRSDPSLSYLSY